MEETFECGDVPKYVNYPLLLMHNAQKLKEQIKTLEDRREEMRASAYAKIKRQRDYVRELEKEKVDIIGTINRLKEMDSSYEGTATRPKGFSMKRYETLRQHVEDLENQVKYLDEELRETRRKCHHKQRIVSQGEMRWKKFHEFKSETLHKETQLKSIMQMSNELQDSCKHLQVSIRSMLYVLSAFYKRQKNVRLLLIKRGNGLQEAIHTATIAYRSKEQELKCKFAMLCERTKVDRKQITDGIAEIKELVANDQKLKELKVSKLRKVRKTNETYDPFCEKYREMSNAEKIFRCEVILSRIFQESGVHETKYVCRKYSEIEMENRRIFEHIDGATSEAEKLYHDIRALRIEIKENSRQRSSNLTARKAKIDELEEATEKFRKESNQLETLVDDKDESLAHAKQLISRMLDAAAPKHVVDKLKRTSVDCDLKLYLHIFEESVNILLEALAGVLKQQTIASGYQE